MLEKFKINNNYEQYIYKCEISEEKSISDTVIHCTYYL